MIIIYQIRLEEASFNYFDLPVPISTNIIKCVQVICILFLLLNNVTSDKFQL